MDITEALTIAAEKTMAPVYLQQAIHFPLNEVRHSNGVLFCCVSGTLSLRLLDADQINQPLSLGDAVFLPYLTPYRCTGADYTILILHVNVRNVMIRLLTATDEMFEVHNFHNTSNKATELNAAHDGIYHAWRHPDGLAATYARLICGIVYAQRREFPEDIRGSMVGAFAKAHNYVTYCYFEDLNRSRLADMIGIGPDYLNRAFRRFSNQNYAGYVALQRLTFATSYLRKYDWPLPQISDALGYGVRDRFIKQFKKLTGITPHQFRKRLRNSETIGDVLQINSLPKAIPLGHQNLDDLFFSHDPRRYHTFAILNGADSPRQISSMNKHQGLDPMVTLRPGSMTLLVVNHYSHWVSTDLDGSVVAIFQLLESAFATLD